MLLEVVQYLLPQLYASHSQKNSSCLKEMLCGTLYQSLISAYVKVGTISFRTIDFFEHMKLVLPFFLKGIAIGRSTMYDR